MKVNLFLDCKIKDKDILGAFDDYKRRCEKFTIVNVYYEINEKLILGEKNYNIIHSASGKYINSIEFSEILKKCSHDRFKNFNIIFDEKCLDGVNKICFVNEKFFGSFLCVMVVEQIYRAYKIIKNEPYHK